MIAAVLLAAGRSSRYGGAGDTKLLLPWGPEAVPMVAAVADTLAVAGVGRLVAVLGHRADAVAAALEDRPVKTVLNPDYAAGLSTSIAAGVRAAPAGASGYLIALGDMPAVTAATVALLCRVFEAAAAPAIAVPAHAGRRGHPVLFGGAFREELLTLSGDMGARRLLARHAGRVVEVAVDDGGVLTDVDTEAQYRAAATAD